MSEKYCIEKILEKPGRVSPEEKYEVHEIRASGQDGRILEGTSDGKRHAEEGYMLHVPRTYPRPMAYRPLESVCHVKSTRCYCQEPSIHTLPAWVADASCSHYGKAYDYRTYVRQPYFRSDDRDHTAFGNSSLATRIKQQQSVSSAGGSRRKKRHRTAFTPTQLLGLENAFEQSHYSVGEERKQLASFLGLSETQIKVWFQNRRTKWKRIRKEAEEMSLTEDEAEPEPQYETSIPRCGSYYQRSEGAHLKLEHGHRYDKRWPMHHTWSQERGRF